MNWWALGLLWLLGINLRIGVLAVPPLIPYIHEDLALSEKAIGALGGLPVLMFAFGALFGSLLLSRVGVIRALTFGLALAALAGALRGAGPHALILFAMTLAMGLGIAVMQPALPTLVGFWFPRRLGLATAVYVNGLLVGEIIGVALTTTVILPLAGGSWGLALAFWSLLMLLNIALLWVALGRGTVTRPGLRGSGAPPRWWPDWSNGEMIRCGLIMCCASSVYFTSNAFLPDYLHALDRPHLVEPALAALNGGQLPASALLLVWADRLVGRAWPLVGVGLVAAAAAAGLILSDAGAMIVTFSGILGFCAAFMLIMTLALPPMLAHQDDVHRFSAGVLVIGYCVAFLVPLLSGALWDLTHWPAVAFLPVAAAGVVLASLASTLHFFAAPS
ncbi:MAG: MFS transporter [Methyloligellaceae bacterium]